MATFKPEPIVGKIYQDLSDKTYKVISVKGDEVDVIRLKSDGTNDSSEISWTENKWNSRKMREKDKAHETTNEGKNLGEAPEFPPIFFAYDPSTKKLEVKDRRGNVITGFDVMTVNGKDGDSAYQLWKNGQKPGTDVSFEAFLNAFRGAKGERGIQGPTGPQGEQGDIWMPIISTDGESLYFRNSKGEETNRFPIKGVKGDQGLQGVQGPIGPKGDKGEAWIPVVTNDGCFLYFRNAEGEKTERFPIKGVKGDQGIQGVRGMQGETGPVYTPRINSDGTLSWTNNGNNLPNPTPVNLKGERGEKGEEGVTFQPIVKEGVIYWTNNQGKDNPDPVRIVGPQGDRGDVGRTGLSAYQIWLKAGNLGTEQDFLNSLKGEKGEPFDPSKIVEFKVEDYTCPIQEINTRLIVGKNESCEDADTIIDKRIDKIAQLREEGQQKAKGWKYWINPVNLLKEFTWMCAGADRPLLRMCPGDHTKYVGIGTVILFTALMAWFSSFIAMQLVFEIDVPKDADFWTSIKSNWTAIAFATFWAAMIFCLDRFITNTMYSDGKVSISKQEFLSGLPRIVIAIFLGIIISAPLELKIFDKAISAELISGVYKETDTLWDQAQQKISDNESHKIQKIDADIEQLIRYRDTVKQDKIRLGSRPTFRTTIIKNGDTTIVQNYDSRPIFKKAEAEYDSSLKRDNELIVYYDSLIHVANKKRNEVEQSAVNDLGNKKGAIDTVINSKDNRLLARLDVLHDLAMKKYVSYNGGKENTWLDYITLHPLWYYLLFSPIGLIMLLFILIDISPVFYKMMLADGKYENYIHQDRLLAQDKIRLSLAKMLKHLNDSELKRVAPFVMGDIYEKMAGDSFIYKTEEEYQNEHLAQKPIHWAWRVWPFSMLRWMFWKEKEKPSAPVIVMEGKRVSKNEEILRTVNDKVFEEVLDMKRRLILASYRRWYKTQYYQLDPNGDDGIVPPPDNFPGSGDGSSDPEPDVINIPPTGNDTFDNSKYERELEDDDEEINPNSYNSNISN